MLEEVSLTVAPGERVALDWPNGAGKTTLARIACGLLAPNAGTVLVDGSAEDLWRRVGYVRQDPVSQIVCATVADEVAFGPRNLGLPAGEVEACVDEALTACGIGHLRECLTYELSGGEQQLLAVAGVLAMRPSYLVLDEASSMLDAESRERLESAVGGLLAKGVGVLEIAHPGGACEEFGAVEEFRQNVRRIPSCVNDIAQSRGCGEAPTAETSSPDMSKTPCDANGFTQPGILRTNPPKSYTAPNSSHAAVADARLELRDVSCRALHGCSLAAGPGLTLLTGPCGSGKTTAARVMAGVLAPEAGEALLNGEAVHAAQVGLCFQRPGDALFETTVLEDLMYGPLMRGAAPADAEAAACAAAVRLGVGEELLARSPFELSGGQARRVALAGVLAANPAAYVFDEPEAGLDAEGREGLRALVEGLVQEGKTVVLTTHSPEEWAGVAVERVRMEGRAAEAKPSHALIDPRVAVALLLAGTVAAFAARTWAGAAIVAAGLLAAAIATHTSPKSLLCALRPAALLFALVLVCNAVVLYPAPGLSGDGFARGLVAVARVAATVGFVRCLVDRGTLPRLAELLPRGSASAALGVALRFLPLTMDEVERVRSAQLARGARLDDGGPLARLKAWKQVLVPLIVGLFRRADDLAEAMASRGWRA